MSERAISSPFSSLHGEEERYINAPMHVSTPSRLPALPRCAAALRRLYLNDVCRCISGKRKQARLAQERFGPAGHGEPPCPPPLPSVISARQIPPPGSPPERGAHANRTESSASPTSDPMRPVHRCTCLRSPCSRIPNGSRSLSIARCTHTHSCNHTLTLTHTVTRRDKKPEMNVPFRILRNKPQH